MRGRNEKRIDQSHLPPKDYAQQLILLREKYSHWGPTGQNTSMACRKNVATEDAKPRGVLSLLQGYPGEDGQLAMARAIQYHAYGYQSLEQKFWRTSACS
ncbi:MAG: hypothetical protein R3C53_16215 [Pirellulaceae bacterium]